MRFGFSGIASTLLYIDLIGVEVRDSCKAGIFKVCSSESSISLNFRIRLVFIGSLLVDEAIDFPELGLSSSIDSFLMISGVLSPIFIAS